MRKGIAVLALTALTLLAFAPPAAASVSASVSPTSVNFGRVPFEGGCVVGANDVPNEFCVTRTLTITNTGTEALFGAGAGACERFLQPQNSCVTLHASWGGFTGSGTSTCLSGISLAPGDSCTVILVASPSRPGLIRGVFTITMASTVNSEDVAILVVPVRLLAVVQQ
jgi:hypothetical protein